MGGVEDFLFYFLDVIILLIPCGKCGSPFLRKVTVAAREQHCPFLLAVCAVCLCVQTVAWLQVLWIFILFYFLTCAQMLMHQIAHAKYGGRGGGGIRTP